MTLALLFYKLLELFLELPKYCVKCLRKNTTSGGFLIGIFEKARHIAQFLSPKMLCDIPERTKTTPANKWDARGRCLLCRCHLSIYFIFNYNNLEGACESKVRKKTKWTLKKGTFGEASNLGGRTVLTEFVFPFLENMCTFFFYLILCRAISYTACFHVSPLFLLFSLDFSVYFFLHTYNCFMLPYVQQLRAPI